jgi:transposase
VHTIAEVGDVRIRRRRHSDEFKEKVVAACRRPGVSIAAVALAHGLNANLLRRWVHEREGVAAKPRLPALQGPRVSDSPPSFVPLALTKPSVRTGDIQVELWRNELKVSVTWPASASAECAAWLRELMR